MAARNLVHVCIGLLLFCHVMLDVTSVDSQTCEAVIPVDTPAKVGDKTVLKCRLSSPNIAWTFCSRNSKPKLIAYNCAVVEPARSSYRVDKSNNGCNLVIDNVTASHLGHYTCQDLSLHDEGHTVELGNSNENLALNKKAILSSTLAGSLSPNVGVDGKTNPTWDQNCCFHSTNAAPEWWAVDLEQEVSVGHVRLINTNHPNYFRLHDFYIGTTNVSPWVTPPTNFTEISICKWVGGTAPGGVPINIFCDPDTQPGRYVFLMMNHAEYLHFAEFEVYL